VPDDQPANPYSVATLPAATQVLEVLQGIPIAQIPLEGRAFLLTIFGGEAPLAHNPWTVEVGYTYWTGSLDAFPPWPGIPAERGLVSTAFGAFQITHTTFNRWIQLPGAPHDMQPTSQCLLAWLGGQHDYHTNSHGRDLLGDLKDSGLWGNVQTYCSGIWPGGAAGFTRRYPANLALLKQPPLPPQPTSLNLHLTQDATLVGQDDKGAEVSIVLKAGAVVSTMLAIALLSANFAVCKPSKPPEQQTAIAVAIPVPPHWGFWLDNPPDFRLVPDPTGTRVFAAPLETRNGPR
jgi:hypothetical protein